MTGAAFTALDPSQYGRTPWKNGGGVAIDIAGESRPGAAEKVWGATLWRFGRTTISEGAPFSDLSGFERWQMVVAGRGLVLETGTGEIDVREPFSPVRFAGETAIVSRLEEGPVEVVNLIAARSHAAIELTMLSGEARALAPGIHLFHAAADACVFSCDGVRHELAAGHTLRLDCSRIVSAQGMAGRSVLASVVALTD